MYYPIAICIILTATMFNMLLAIMAYNYNVIGHGLNPTVAAALGASVTTGLLVLISVKGIRREP